MSTNKAQKRGLTLIETMVAIALLMLALIPPMSLASQALTSAFYARNQITAFYLAQEGIEIVRAVRDANIIALAEGNSSVNIFDNIPHGASLAAAPEFTVDSLQTTSNALNVCQQTGGVYHCPPLQTNGSLYSYSLSCGVVGGAWTTQDCPSGSGWTDTTFTRYVQAYVINGNSDELRVTVTVTWQLGSFSTRTFTISEDLYKWVTS